MRFIVLIFTTIIASFQLSAQTLEVCVTNIRNTKGQLCIAIFKSNEDFKAETPFWEKKYSKAEIENKTCKFVIPIPYGEYGLSVLDDENSDGRINYNFVGFPIEGFGFSNYNHRGIRKPQYKQFIFKVEDNQTIPINVKMTYM